MTQKLRFFAEANRIMGLAAPVTVSEVISFLAYVISTAKAGELGPMELSAITLGRSVYHITGLSL